MCCTGMKTILKLTMSLFVINSPKTVSQLFKMGDEESSNCYFHLHVAKCGGASFRQELKKLCHEHSDHPFGYVVSQESRLRTIYNKQIFPKCEGEIKVMDIFREPTSHVISQYSHCTTAKVLKDIWDTIPPLSDWLTIYVDLKVNSTSWDNPLRCYNPINKQRSFLGTGHNDKETQPQDLWFVGILEYFVASKCLLLYQLFGKIERGCDCRETEAIAVAHDVHSGIKIKESEISDDDYAKIRRITQDDKILYENAIAVFFQRIRTVEQENNVQLLCGDDAIQMERFVSNATKAILPR